MMKQSIACIPLLNLILICSASGQMIDGPNVKYGNEWIDYNKSYYKIPVTEDGIYKIAYQDLISAGMNPATLVGNDFQIHEHGEEIPLMISTNEHFSSSDFILFYGKKNKGKIDKYLYELPSKQLNPEYSLFTDTLIYFLSLDPGKINNRFDTLENDLNINLPFVEEYYWHEETLVNHSDHFKPTYDGTNKVTYSHLDVPEGFSSPMREKNDYVLPVTNFRNVGEKPILKVRLATSTSPHKTNISLNGDVIDIIYATGYTVTDQSVEIQTSQVKDQMQFTFEGTDVTTSLIDRNSQSVVSLHYPRNFVFTGQKYTSFRVRATQFPKYFEIPNLDVNQQNVLLFDVTNGSVLIPEIDLSNTARFIIPPSNLSRNIVIINQDTAPKNIEISEKIEFIDFGNFDEEYIIISHSELRKEYNGLDQVQAYADYRSSDQGANYKTIIVNVNEIYDQFGYGIQRHSQSLNNFSNYIKAIWTEPKFFFIIGKGRDYVETRTEEQLSDPKNLFYVPTLGFHGSDVLMISAKGENAPGIPLGRIAVKDPGQIEEYLDKVRQHENYQKYGQNLEEKEWMKKIIHLSGGDANIQELLRNYLDEMGEVIENSSFGANIVTYGRTSGTATEAVTEKITEDINEGASIITFFGHSGVSTSDFNIGDLNNNKYPLFLSLGCYSGDIHTYITTGQSERFVLSPHGAIAFIGAAGTAYITPQYIFGKELYIKLGEELYGKTIGEAFSAVLDLKKNNTALSIKSLNQQLTLHGDPAIKLNPHNGPDYVCDYRSVQTLPQVVNSNEEHFEFTFDVVNLGKWVDDSLSIRAIRQYPDNSYDTIYTKIAAPNYRNQLTLKLPTGNSKGIGQNCVFVLLDYDQKFEEKEAPEAENNNTLENDLGEQGFCFYIINNGAKPIYPSEFSIVNEDPVILKASTYNYFVETQDYLFQIDTTELFNSPFLTEHMAEYDGGLLEWQPPVNFQNENVYYWRVSPDTLQSGLGYLWAYSSFIYLPQSSEGWNQSHKYQYEKDDFQGIVTDGWELNFDKESYLIRFKNKKYDPDDRYIGYVNESTWAAFNPVNYRPALHIAVWGPERVMYNETGTDYGTIAFNNKSFTFKTETTNDRKGIKDLFEAIPDSSIVFAFTVLDDENTDLNTSTWAQDSVSLGYNLFSLFESYGAKDFRKMELQGSLPYVYIFQKGKGAIEEKIGENFDDIVEASHVTTLNQQNGKLLSTVIGPVKDWNKVLWEEQKTSANDYSFLKVFKADQSLSSFQIVDTLNEKFELDISTINAQEYPYLKLEYEAQDDEFNRDLPDFNFWRVLYSELPDAVLLMDEYSLFQSDTLNFGGQFSFKATALNNSNQDMDSLDVRFIIKKTDNSEAVFNKKYKPLLAHDTIHVAFDINTTGMSGINEFTVELNPDRTPWEKYYFNNIGIKRFYVRSDSENPILDVTFDGIHIMDGDIVSPKPEIQMALKDENTFLLLNDPNIFTKIKLQYPGGQSVDIPIDSDQLEFIPAENSSENVAKMIFKPELDVEGIYTLTVQARDVSNNMAGDNEFQVDFNVILEQQISNVYNYPNPFSTSTQFVFTITGYEIPEYLTIRILTLGGKVVREITKEELGPLRIGNNITEYAWDGKDEYGDKLGNGVYLYQVYAKNASGETFSLMENGENDSRFFKKGWGKMAILR